MAAAGPWVIPTTSNFVKYYDGTFDFNSDTFKCALFLSTSNISVASTTYAGVTNEVANGVGYTTGGYSIGAGVLSGTTTQKWVWTNNATWTASGGNIVARFAVIYEVGGSVICYCLLDSTPANVTCTDGSTLTIALNASGIWSAVAA